MQLEQLKINNTESIIGVEKFMANQAEEKSNIVTIPSRYGNVSVNLEKSIFFPKGLLGMPEFKDFAVTELPNPKMAKFKLLQSLNDSQLSFLVLPYDAASALISKEDIEECKIVNKISDNDLVVLFILTVQNTPDGKTKVTANLRAPIVVDSKDKLAIQYVFPNGAYDIRHILIG